jgi:16S rRNA (uracil1498-N3)-methyltransferase
MNRFFVSEGSIKAGKVELAGQQAHQIRSVLRMSRGDCIVVLDNQGCEYEVVLEKVTGKEVTGRVTEKRPACGEPGVRITLYQSLLAREKFEWVLAKCTEVGVARFVPMVTQRSLIRRADAVSAAKLDRWRRIITEAAEQSRRGRIPELAAPVRFEDAVSGLSGFERCLVAWPQARSPHLRELLGSGRPATIAVFIGPEGGFTDRELQLVQAGGAVPISLGPRILRTETAAMVAAALVLYELGETHT